jgi:hypothetical protein
MTRSIFLGAALMLSAAACDPVAAHEALAVTLDRFEEEIREHPENYLERSERAWLMLEHGMVGAPVGEDIDTLWSKPAWRQNAMRLRAWHLYLQDRHREAGVQARKNIEAGAIGPEQFRLLAGSALVRKDTASALKAYREGWELLRLEEDYISMVRLSQGGGDVPDALLQEGLRAYPKSPGVHAVIFQAYLKNKNPASLRKALALSDRGQSQLWPRSVDWKVWHARALLAAHKVDSAEAVLLRAMDFLENETRLRSDSDLAMHMRQEIFELLDEVKVKRK